MESFGLKMLFRVFISVSTSTISWVPIICNISTSQWFQQIEPACHEQHIIHYCNNSVSSRPRSPPLPNYLRNSHFLTHLPNSHPSLRSQCLKYYFSRIRGSGKSTSNPLVHDCFRNKFTNKFFVTISRILLTILSPEILFIITRTHAHIIFTPYQSSLVE